MRSSVVFLQGKLAMVCLAAAVVMSGCRKAETAEKIAPSQPMPTNPPAPTATAEKSTARTVVDGITGRAAVEAGRAAQQQIQEIHAKEQSALDEVLKDQ